MLEEHIEYIKRLQNQKRLPKLIEIILVDDGSKDKTLQYIRRMSEEHPYESQSPCCFVTGIRQLVNQGKGAAVKIGTLYSRGKYVLMLDADGATDVNELEKIWQKVNSVAESNQKQFGCVIGSRNIDETQVKRTAVRKMLNFCMHKLCYFVLG